MQIIKFISGDPEAQAELIAHLQDEHYAQYMSQLSMRESDNEPVPAPQGIHVNIMLKNLFAYISR